MRVVSSFKALRRLFALVTTLGLTVSWTSGCGLLGDKKAASRTLAQDNACLDRLSGLLNDFMDGLASEAEWIRSWNCVDDTLNTFVKFVRSESPEGYTRSDVQALMQKFIFAKKTVKPELVEGLFYVKSTLLGGGYEHVSKDQVERVRAIVRLVRDEGAQLIPHLYHRKHKPTSAQLRELANAVENFGKKLNQEISPDPTKSISKEMLVRLARNLAEVAPNDDPSKPVDPEKVAAWGAFLSEAKTLIVRGPDGAISGDDIKNILDLGLQLGGPFLSFVSVEVDDPEFMSEMVDRITNALQGSIARWGTEIPFKQFEKMFESAPMDLLRSIAFKEGKAPTPEIGDQRAEELRKAILVTFKSRKKQLADGSVATFRPAAARLTLSQSDTGLDKNAINSIKTIYKKGARSNAHLNKMWAGAADYLTVPQFEAMANTYKTGLPSNEAQEVEYLKTLAKRYKGHYLKDNPATAFDESKSMDFTTTNWDKHSLNNLNRMSWYEGIAELILKAYGSSSDAFGKAGTVDDLLILTEDITLLLNAFSMVHPETKEVHKKRFREANLFMPNGNGDKLMNLPETAVYIGYLQSIGKSAKYMLDRVKGSCKMAGIDPKVLLPSYDITCFRDEFFNQDYKNYWDAFPGLIKEYETYDSAQKARFAYAYEAAAKIPTYNNDPVSEFDMSSFSGIPHYVETVMYKYDTNRDGVFSRSEILNDIFPIFQNELQGFTNSKMKIVNQAILLWLMQKGRSPFKCAKKPSGKEIIDLIGWLVTGGPFKGFTANRLSVYEVFATLGLPPPPGCPVPASSSALEDGSTIGVERDADENNGYDELLEYFPTEL